MGLKLIRHESRKHVVNPKSRKLNLLQEPTVPRNQDQGQVASPDGGHTRASSPSSMWHGDLGHFLLGQPPAIRSPWHVQPKGCGEMGMGKRRRQVEGMKTDSARAGVGWDGVAFSSKGIHRYKTYFQKHLHQGCSLKMESKPLKCQEVWFLPRPQNAEDCKERWLLQKGAKFWSRV